MQAVLKVLSKDAQSADNAAGNTSSNSKSQQSQKSKNEMTDSNQGSESSLRSNAAGLAHHVKAASDKRARGAAVRRNSSASEPDESSDSWLPSHGSSSDTSPTFSSSPGMYSSSRHGNGTLSDQTESAMSRSDSSDSAEVNSSPRIRHWPDSHDTANAGAQLGQDHLQHATSHDTEADEEADALAVIAEELTIKLTVSMRSLEAAGFGGGRVGLAVDLLIEGSTAIELQHWHRAVRVCCNRCISLATMLVRVVALAKSLCS